MTTGCVTDPGSSFCVCCGEPVPEGRMVCWGCEHSPILTKGGEHGGRDIVLALPEAGDEQLLLG